MIMLAEAIQTAQQAAPETWAEAVGPIVMLASLLWGGWQTIKASKKAALLRAAIVGVKAALADLDVETAETVKGKIEAAAGGKSAPLNQELKAEVRKTTSSMVAYRPDGLPSLMLLVLLVPLALCSGCVNAAVHESALAAQSSAKILRAASVPDPRYTEADRKSWERLWQSHEAAIRAIEEASR